LRPLRADFGEEDDPSLAAMLTPSGWCALPSISIIA
jgi:hypothetical protein